MPRAIRVIAFVTAVLIASVVFWRQFLDPDAPVRRLTRRIERRIPVGSTKGSVYDFLETGHFAFSGYNVGPDPIKLPGENPERKRYITATVPVTGVMPCLSYDYIRIAFYFDEEELLSEYKLQPFSDSP